MKKLIQCSVVACRDSYNLLFCCWFERLKQFISTINVEMERKLQTPGGLSGTGETNVTRTLWHIGSTPAPRKAAVRAQSQPQLNYQPSITFKLVSPIQKTSMPPLRMHACLSLLVKRFVCFQFPGFNYMADEVFITDNAERQGFTEQFLHTCSVRMCFSFCCGMQFACMVDNLAVTNSRIGIQTNNSKMAYFGLNIAQTNNAAVRI